MRASFAAKPEGPVIQLEGDVDELSLVLTRLVRGDFGPLALPPPAPEATAAVPESPPAETPAARLRRRPKPRPKARAHRPRAPKTTYGGPGSRIPPGVRAKGEDLIRKGRRSLLEVADTLGVPVTAVRNWKYRMNHPAPAPASEPEPEPEPTVEPARESVAAEEVAAPSTSQDFPCEECSRVFASARGRTKHKTATHGWRSTHPAPGTPTPEAPPLADTMVQKVENLLYFHLSRGNGIPQAASLSGVEEAQAGQLIDRAYRLMGFPGPPRGTAKAKAVWVDEFGPEDRRHFADRVLRDRHPSSSA
jgi:hypothetical protein